MPLVMTWKKIGTLTVIPAAALPLADAGMSWTTWPVSFSRIVPRLSAKPPRALTPPPSGPQAPDGQGLLGQGEPRQRDVRGDQREAGEQEGDATDG